MESFYVIQLKLKSLIMMVSDGTWTYVIPMNHFVNQIIAHIILCEISQIWKSISTNSIMLSMKMVRKPATSNSNTEKHRVALQSILNPSAWRRQGRGV